MMNDDHVLPMVCSVTLFDNYLVASTFHQILNCFNQLCLGLQVDPLDYQTFYHRLKNKLTNWKAQKLWTLLDKRASQKEYRKQKSCQNLRVLIIGAGPCGLRMAIECALLGCKVVLLEKRDRFSRNNVLHIWPFVIQDLKNLGAKLFHPKFCAGSIDHISIRQLQCMLLKIALLLGVEVHENVSFEELLEPSVGENGEKFGWRARVSPENHYVSEYEFDALIGADGKRNTVPGFRRKEFRGKLAIAITANFINRHTEMEERVQEISGVAFIFNQQFFKDMRSQTGIDLENIVYYKDDTHYFVMTAKKQSLLEKNVIENDYDDISMLLHPDNIDQGALMAYARQAADFATESKLPNLEFAFNHHALPDVAMFDFTSLFSAETSCRLFERKDYRLLVGIVGDSLHEPFWPTGSGCARGFLSVFDASWMFKSYCSSKSFPLEVLAQRESTYRLLAQTTTENLNKNIQMYTIDPKSRYPRLEFTILPNQARSLVDTDNWSTMELTVTQSNSLNETTRRISSSLTRRSVFESTTTYAKHQQLIRWYQQIVLPYRLRVDNLTQSFRSGMVLNAVLHRFRPDTTPDLSKLKLSDIQGNCGRAFDLVRSEFGIDPPLSVCDRNLMYEYLFSIYDSLRKETPSILIPSPAQRSLAGTLIRTAGGVTTLKRKSPDVETAPILFNSTSSRHARGDDVESDEKTKERHRRRLERLEAIQQHHNGSSANPQSSSALNKITKKPTMVEKLSENRLKDFERMLENINNVRKREIRMKKPTIKTRKLEKKEIDEMEEKLKTTAMGHLLAQSKPPVEPNLSTHDAKIIAEKTNVLKQKAQKGFQEDDKYDFFDKSLTNLERKLRLPNQSGAVAVAALLQQHNENISSTVGGPMSPPAVPLRKKPPVPLPHEKSDVKQPTTPLLISPIVESNQQHPKCFFCEKRVYLAEKLTIENVSCHSSCFRCAVCDCKMRLNAYGMERIDVVGDGRYTRQFFCLQHLNLSLSEKIVKLKMQKEKRRNSFATTIDVDVVDSSTTKPTAAKHYDPPVIEFKPLPNSSKRILAPVMQNNLNETTTTSTNLLMPILPTSSNLNSSFSIDVQDTPERAEFEVSFRAGGGTLKTLKRSQESLIEIDNDGGGDGVQLTKRDFADSDDEFIADIDDVDEVMEEEEVLLHNMGYSSRDKLNDEGIVDHGYKNGDTGEEIFEPTTEVNGTDDDDNPDESDKDDDDSSDLSAAEETALADCLSKRAAELPSELTYEEAAIVAQTLKQQRSAESGTVSSQSSDAELDESDTSSENSSDDSSDVDSLTDSKKPIASKKKLIYTPPPTSKADETLFFTPTADVEFRSPQTEEFKIPQTPSTFKPKKILYLHSTNEEGGEANVVNQALGDDFAPPESPLRLAKMKELNRLREESRAKAKLKSDEELAQRLSSSRFSVNEIRNELLDDARAMRSKSASQEVLPSPSKDISTSIEELTKRRANSEEAKYVHFVGKPSSIASNDPSTSVDTPLSDAPSSATSKRSSIFSRLFNMGSSSSPPKPKENGVLHSPADQANTSASTVDSPLANVNVTSESTRETNLLGKLGLRKYNRSKTRVSASPPKEQKTNVQQKLDASVKTSGASTTGVAPKATVDEMYLSDTSPESPVRPKPNAVADTMKLSTVSNLSTSTVPGSMSLASLQSGDSSTINDRDIRRVQRAAAKMAKQQEQKRIHRAQEIQRSLQELDVRRQQIEFVGRDIERRLKNDSENKELCQHWLDLVTEKDNLLKQDVELNLKVKDLELENEHCQLQQEIRERMSVPTTKTSKDLQEDKKMLERCLDIVSRRDELVTRMERERVKEKEQNEHLKKVLNRKGFNYRDYEPCFLAADDSGMTSTEVKYKSALHSLV